jgi:hypothetical protein
MALHIISVIANGFGHLGIQYWAIHANIPHWQQQFYGPCFSQMGHVMAIRSDEN